ncbi:hypothetical protein [Phytobacter sp. AG2a]
MARTEIRVGRYIIDFVPLLFLVITAILCNQLNDSVKTSHEAVKLANDMNRQRTAAEMRAQKAEQSPADGSSLNVIVIQPDGKQRASYTEPAFADVNKPL